MLDSVVDYLAILYLLTSLVLIGSSRLGMLIRAVAVQGMVLAVLPVVKEIHHLTVGTVVLCIVTMAIKGWAFPALFRATVKRVTAAREIEPLIGYNASLLAGVGMLVFAFWLQRRLPVGRDAGLLLPTAFFGMWCGFFVTCGRRKALTQILGYLALENGIFAFGTATLSDHPWMLELGVLLDVLVAVFIMGIAIHHINREFSHMDADRLASLRDPAGEP